MAIQTKCPSCKAQYNLGDTMLGKKVQCKKCFDTFVVLAGKKTYDSKQAGPMVVGVPFKTISNQLFYAHGYRIKCDNCQEPFVYIAGGIVDASMSGLPLLTSDGVMQQDAFREAITEIPLENVGHGICPHCHCYQKSMVKASQNIDVGLGTVLGVIAFAISTMMLFGGDLEGLGLLVDGGIIVVLLCLAGSKLAKNTFLTRGPHPGKEDPHSMSDEEFEAFLTKEGGGTMDPFLVWWIQCGNTPDANTTPLSLGLADTTGEPRFPDVASTDLTMQNYLA